MEFKEINDHFKQLNKDISGLNKELKQQQKEKKQRSNDNTLTLLKLISDDMRLHHASEESIKLALKGTYEYLKVAANAYLPQSRINSLVHHENRAKQNTSIFSTPLSKIESKDINWLWTHRIPQGKITVLEGDPGMGKSLLAIGIIAAARTCMTIFHDPADEKKRVLAVTKSNLSEPPQHLSYKVVPGESMTPRIQWLGEIDLDISTLSGPGINLSFPRQQIIKALQSSKRSLNIKEIAEITGLNYKTLRMTLSRMHEAGLIAHPYRGTYTTLENHAESQKRMEEQRKENELWNEAFNEAFRKNIKSDATVTNSLKFGSVSQHDHMLPDLCGSYRHSYREQWQGNPPGAAQAVQ